MGLRWPLSQQQVCDGNGAPCPGAQAYFYAGGTSTPLTVYQDAALTMPLPSPVTADATGRFPFVFVPYGAYGEKVLTAAGMQLWNQPTIANDAPAGAGGGGASATALSTGDVIWSPMQGVRTGFVRLNGRTIGSAASGATERANTDTQNLFVFLWNNMPDSLCPVSTGRGATALADFNANKTITLLDARTAALMGVSDMGNSSNGGFSGAFVVSGGGPQPGSVMGENTHTLTAGELPAHAHPATATSTSTSTPSLTATSTTTGTTDAQGDHNHTQYTATAGTVNVTASGGSQATSNFNALGSLATGTANAGSHSHNLSATTTTTISGSVTTTTTTTVTVNNSTGGGGAHNNVPRALLGTWFQAL